MKVKWVTFNEIILAFSLLDKLSNLCVMEMLATKEINSSAKVSTGGLASGGALMSKTDSVPRNHILECNNMHFIPVPQNTANQLSISMWNDKHDRVT